MISAVVGLDTQTTTTKRERKKDKKDKERKKETQRERDKDRKLGNKGMMMIASSHQFRYAERARYSIFSFFFSVFFFHG